MKEQSCLLDDEVLELDGVERWPGRGDGRYRYRRSRGAWEDLSLGRVFGTTSLQVSEGSGEHSQGASDPAVQQRGGRHRLVGGGDTEAVQQQQSGVSAPRGMSR